MRAKSFSYIARTAAAAAVIASAALVAHAGPPLVCWKVQTGDAKSLPWDTTVLRFDGSRADYKTKNLMSDTLALLGPETSVIVRMETLRRAALYATKDPTAGRELLTRLIERAQTSVPGSGSGATARASEKLAALAWFDAGYFLESCRQAADSVDNRHVGSKILSVLGVRNSGDKILQSEGGVNGYTWVVKALTLRGSDPEMELAAALMTSHPRRPEHEGHLARAAAGASEGSLLARNIVQFFGDRGKTLEAIRSNLQVAAR